MANMFVFADEAGNFAFKRQKGVSKYFVLCTFTTEDCTISHDLLAIRRELILAGETDRDKLHATSDLQHVRDRVFKCLADHAFRVDATLLEKSKARPQTRTSDPTFYRYAWYYHFKHVAPLLLSNCEKMLITAASIGSKKTKAAFKNAVNNTLQQTVERERWQVSFMDSCKDPLLWAADYCAWAIQRKWQLNDARSHQLISEKIATEFDLWEPGTTHYH